MASTSLGRSATNPSVPSISGEGKAGFESHLVDLGAVGGGSRPGQPRPLPRPLSPRCAPRGWSRAQGGGGVDQPEGGVLQLGVFGDDHLVVDLIERRPSIGFSLGRGGGAVDAGPPEPGASCRRQSEKRRRPSQSDSRKASRAAAARPVSASNLVRAPSASPPCHKIDSSSERARPSWRNRVCPRHHLGQPDPQAAESSIPSPLASIPACRPPALHPCLVE